MTPDFRQEFRYIWMLCKLSFTNTILAFLYISVYILLQHGLNWITRSIGYYLGLGASHQYEWLPVLLIQVIVAVGTIVLFIKYFIDRVKKSFAMISEWNKG